MYLTALGTCRGGDKAMRSCGTSPWTCMAIYSQRRQERREGNEGDPGASGICTELVAVGSILQWHVYFFGT